MTINAYIDAANLHQGTKVLDWEFDYARFRIWLKQKYQVQNAYLFIGLLPSNSKLYTQLQEFGYILVYKEVLYSNEGMVKGNCDAELVLKTVSDFYEHRFDRAVLVSSDGDYACLASFLKERQSIQVIISPHNKSSYLLRKLNCPIVYLKGLSKQLEKRKSPQEGWLP